MNYRTATPLPERSGFTLVELLIVIGIIAVLISIVLPAVGKVRVAAQKVATQNTINRLEQGCSQYFTDYNAYPGPFSEDQLAPAGTTPTYLQPGGPAFPLEVPNPTTPGAYLPFQRVPTTSENLFLGLCGGLRVTTVGGVGGATHFFYDNEIAKQGRGPSWLSLSAAKKSQDYMQLSDGDIASQSDQRNPLVSNPATVDSFWWPPTAAGGVPYGANFVGDSTIYEFMDRFSKPKPILYLRARRGVTRTGTGPSNRTGFIFDPAATPSEVEPFQYDPTKIQWTYSNIGKYRSGMPQAGNTWAADQLDYPDVMNDAGTIVKFNRGNERYFVNEQISTGNPGTMGANANLVPVHKDGFILISAGADGLYGTADDIRN